MKGPAANYSEGDAELAEGIMAGDERAFRLAYDNYHGHLYYYALKFVKSPELAKEVVHDVFMKLWEGRRGLKKELSFRGYLLTICKNHVLNLLKRAGRETSIKAEILRHSAQSHNETEHTVHFADYQRFALEAIEQLPPQRQIIFRMCRIEGRSLDDVAESLGISKGTVRDHLLKASRHIKKYLSVHADLTFGIAAILIAAAALISL